MWPMISGLLQGGMSMLGNIFGQQQNNQMQMQMQQQQENYNTQMSNTAYQRASADMKAAGLNPMMMFGSGSAASSPTAPSVNVQSPFKDVGKDISSAISSAVAMKTADATIDNLVQQNANLKTENALKEAETGYTRVRTGIGHIETDTAQSEAAIRKAAVPVAVNKAITAENESSMDPTARKILDIAGYGGRKASDVLDPAVNLTSSASGLARNLAESSFKRRFYFGE